MYMVSHQKRISWYSQTEVAMIHYTVCMNGLNLSRVFVTKFLGNRVKHVLTSSALYSLYCTLVMPYLTKLL